MHLTNIAVFYRRQAQPAQYEAEEVRLEGSAVVAEGEDFEAIAYDLVTRARVQAHRALGLKEPAIEPFMPAFGESGVDFVLPPTPGEQPARRKRRTKAEMEAARAAEEQADEIDVLGDQPKPADVIYEPPVPSVADLQTAAAAKVRALGGADKIKALMAEYQAPRLGEIPEAKRAAFLADLSALS